MAANSSIEWTDRTWQVTCGCLHKSPGCAHCYAETMAKRLRGMALADIAAGKDPGRKRHYIEAIDDSGHWSGKVVPVPEALADPLGWRKESMVFVDSMSDLFYGDEEDERRCKAKGIPFTPVPFEFIAKCFAVMALTPRHTYQVLTKRASRMCQWFTWLEEVNDGMCDPEALDANLVYQFLSDDEAGEQVSRDDFPAIWPLPNVQLGVSAEDQPRLDERLPWLLKIPASIRFLSVEPLLGPVFLPTVHSFTPEADDMLKRMPKVNWVIVGGESGPGARPCNVAWIRSIVGQCKAAGVACFVKQLGALPFDSANDFPTCGHGNCPNGRLHLADQKGGDPAEWPEDLRVRQFPQEVATT